MPTNMLAIRQKQAVLTSTSGLFPLTASSVSFAMPKDKALLQGETTGGIEQNYRDRPSKGEPRGQIFLSRCNYVWNSRCFWGERP